MTKFKPGDLVRLNPYAYRGVSTLYAHNLIDKTIPIATVKLLQAVGEVQETFYDDDMFGARLWFPELSVFRITAFDNMLPTNVKK